MKILIVKYNCRPGQRDTFLEAIRSEKLDQASRDEDGNLRYAYSRPVDDEDSLLLLETWKDEEAFKKHCASPHFKRLGEVKELYVTDTVLEKYDIDEER